MVRASDNGIESLWVGKGKTGCKCDELFNAGKLFGVLEMDLVMKKNRHFRDGSKGFSFQNKSIFCV